MKKSKVDLDVVLALNKGILRYKKDKVIILSGKEKIYLIFIINTFKRLFLETDIFKNKKIQGLSFKEFYIELKKTKRDETKKLPSVVMIRSMILKLNGLILDYQTHQKSHKSNMRRIHLNKVSSYRVSRRVIIPKVELCYIAGMDFNGNKLEEIKEDETKPTI